MYPTPAWVLTTPTALLPHPVVKDHSPTGSSLFSADGGSRTHTSLRTQDSESCASTSSATSAKSGRQKFVRRTWGFPRLVRLLFRHTLLAKRVGICTRTALRPPVLQCNPTVIRPSAVGGSRTHTSLRTQAPQACASTSSATTALLLQPSLAGHPPALLALLAVADLAHVAVAPEQAQPRQQLLVPVGHPLFVLHMTSSSG